MSDVLNKYYVLVVNAIYMPLGVISVRKALNNLFSSEDGKNMAAVAFDLDYANNGDGLDWMQPILFRTVEIDEWITLPLRGWDVPIHTPRQIIRAPIVIMARNHDKPPKMRELSPNLRNVYAHYKGVDYWTGKKLSLKQASLEHVTPKFHKGGNSWDNLAITDKKLNSKRGHDMDKWPHKGKYPLSKPLPRSPISLITEIARPEWQYFLFNSK